MANTMLKTGYKLSRLLSSLDEKSRAILWHLWWHRHAEIAELREVVGVSGDFEVLYRLKEVINQEAQRLWGKPVVSFEQSKVDSPTPATNDAICLAFR